MDLQISELTELIDGLYNQFQRHLEPNSTPEEHFFAGAIAGLELARQLCRYKLKGYAAMKELQ